MSFEFREGRYFVGFWYVGHTDQNYLAGVYRDEGEQSFHCLYRFRYFRDDKVWNSADERSWHEFVANKTEDEMIAVMDDMVARLLAKGMTGPSERRLIRSADPDVQQMAMTTMQCMSVKLVADENSEPIDA